MYNTDKHLNGIIPAVVSFNNVLLLHCLLLQVIDKSFGFDSAVEEAERAINAAHVEATSIENGVGLVKLMGRYSGMLSKNFS